MPQFFIDRPVFAWVIALFILLAGALAIPQLPVAQYPNIAPPKIEVVATYPGASAQAMDQSVVSLIEEELSGADHLLYFESRSSQGSATITSTFKTRHPSRACAGRRTQSLESHRVAPSPSGDRTGLARGESLYRFPVVHLADRHQR